MNQILMDDLHTTNSSSISSEKPELPSHEVKPVKGFWRELIEFAIIAMLIVVPFRIFIAQPYIVNGASMDPTFKTGDYLIVDQISYRFHTPARGSVIVFRYPKMTSIYFIKRVIGFPGETVSIKAGIVTIINPTHPNGFKLDEPYVKLTKIEDYTTTLKADEYFVMGDNRAGSADSRLWGPLPTKDIIGRPILQLFPLSSIHIIPGDQTAQLTT